MPAATVSATSTASGSDATTAAGADATDAAAKAAPATGAESVLTRDTDGTDVVGRRLPRPGVGAGRDRVGAQPGPRPLGHLDRGRAQRLGARPGHRRGRPGQGRHRAGRRRRVRAGPDPGECPQGHGPARPPRGDLRRRRHQCRRRVAREHPRRDGERRGREAGPDHPRPVGRRREPAQLRPRLRRQGQGRHRAPHGEHQHLLRGPGGRPRAGHLRVPRERQRLVRHRLPVPRRPLRPALRGPLRWRLQERRRRPGPGLQHAVLRHLLDRQPRPGYLGCGRALIGGAERHRQADRLEGVAQRLGPLDLGELHLRGQLALGRGDGHHQAPGLGPPRLQPDHLPG